MATVVSGINEALGSLRWPLWRPREEDQLANLVDWAHERDVAAAREEEEGAGAGGGLTTVHDENAKIGCEQVLSYVSLGSRFSPRIEIE